MVKLTINDKLVEVPEGTTILQAARQEGIKIPTLCYYEAIKPYGGCRLCVVEVTAGPRTSLTASCSYPVAEGIKVQTDTPKVLRATAVGHRSFVVPESGPAHSPVHRQRFRGHGTQLSVGG